MSLKHINVIFIINKRYVYMYISIFFYKSQEKGVKNESIS